MIDRYLVRYFLAVVDHGNFTRAAMHCRVSQPTLSAGISKLERLLGCSLFERSNRRVQLTSAGSRFTSHARKIEAEFIEAARSVSVDPPIDTVRVGLLSSLPAAWCERVATAAASAPERVEIVDGRSRDLRSMLDRGRIDAALTVLNGPGVSAEGETFLVEPYLLAVSANHRLAGQQMVSAEELAGEIMLVRRGCEALSEVSGHFTSRGIRPFMAARATSEERVVNYVRAGLGITVMPRCFSAAGIVMIALAGFPLTRTIGLIAGPGRAPGQHVEALTEISRIMHSIVAESH